MIASKKLSTKWSSSDDLTPKTFGAYKRKIFPNLAPFLTAGQAIKNNREHKIRMPEMNDVYPDTTLPKYYDDLSDEWVCEGQNKFDADIKNYHRSLEKHSICEAELIIFFNETISETSTTKLQNHKDYFVAMTRDNSFLIWKCLESSHDGNHDNYHSICFHTREFVNRVCGDNEDFQKFSIDHQLKMREFAAAMESPLHTGYVSLDLLGSVLMIGSLPTTFWEHKIESISEATANIHNVKYSNTIDTLQSYWSRHSKSDSATGYVLTPSSNTLTILSTVTQPKTVSTDTIICIDCKKSSPKTEMKMFPGQYHKRCKECGLKGSKSRREKTSIDKPSDESIKKVQEYLAKDKPAILTTVHSPSYLTAEDVTKMIAESRPPTFGSFGPGNYVQSNSNTPSSHLTFMFDNCARQIIIHLTLT